MKHLTLLTLSLAAVAAGCSPQTNTPTDETSSSSLSSEMAQQVEYGVAFQGVVEEAGISIYMQGTHRLTMANGDFVLLESDDIDLDAYLGKEVEAYGDARPSVEGDGTILTVTDMTILSEPASSASSVSSPASSTGAVSSSTASSLVASSKAAPVAASVARSSAPRASSVPASSVAKASPAPAASSVSKDAITTRAEAMAAANMAPANWTRMYCPAQRDFCFAIHKNWYYNSFGATPSYLWHVEVSNEPISTLGDGPLAVNLVAGLSADKGGVSGRTQSKGDYVVGYLDWKDGTHFEVTAPAVLQAAVVQITQSIMAAPSSSASSAAARSSASSR